MTREQAQAELRQTGENLVDATIETLEQRFQQRDEADAQAVRTVRNIVAQFGRDAVRELAATGTTKTLNSAQRVSTEALISLTGRPALLVKNHDIDYDQPQIGKWKTPLLLIKPYIPQIVQSVGRIELQGEHVGTGFLVADDLVMTNRHVLEEIAAPFPTSTNPKRWLLANQGVAIDFLRETGSQETLRFAVTEAVFSGPTPTNDTEYVEFTDLDMAILRIEKINAAGQKPPPPLQCLKGDLTLHGSKDALVVGYPARPVDLPVDAYGHIRQEVIDALMRIYGLRYGVKYLSPGEVTTQIGALDGDAEKWVFGHDCTTLGGNSGSCVIRYGPKPAIIGLHFAGELEHSNYAHGLQRIVESKRLPSALAERLTWVEE
jgi:hypothetical protein